ncbi:aspartyl protease [Argonema antarcticum A004/B2]|nr:aspartyl protease [Argonema antarcticum]MCL1470959.1 aspartyl protease [Argonema antarcticum A004/B2]
MIHGKFGDRDELFFEIELIVDNGLELPVDAMLDTGFSGWLAMNKQDIEGVNWTYLDEQMMGTAQGDFVFEIYVGKVRIDGEEFDIAVHVGEGIPEVLIGRQWLKNRRLVVDMQSGVLTLGES